MRPSARAVRVRTAGQAVPRERLSPALGGSAAFAVQVGAENELLVPFMMQNTNDYFEGYETVRFEKAFPGTYTMKMTDLPERRLLRFEVK